MRYNSKAGEQGKHTNVLYLKEWILKERAGLENTDIPFSVSSRYLERPFKCTGCMKVCNESKEIIRDYNTPKQQLFPI